MKSRGHWSRFGDRLSPEEVAEALFERHGPAALEIAKERGLAAYDDDRHEDCLFWLAVYNKLLERQVPPEGRQHEDRLFRLAVYRTLREREGPPAPDQA